MSKERELLKKILATGWLDHELSNEVEELLAQPEQEQEPVAWGYKKRVTYKPEGSEEEEIIPLYTAPQKREPFGPEERQRLSKAYSTRAEQVAFEEGIIFAEILYGIGGGE